MELALALIGLVLLLTIFICLKIGIRIGARKATDFIVVGFANSVRPKDSIPTINEMKSKVGNESLPFGIIGSNKTGALAEIRAMEIGRKLANTAVLEGIKIESERSQPKSDEVSIVMPKKDLQDISWLADSGLRVWISGPENSFRFGERVSKADAERFARMIDSLD